MEVVHANPDALPRAARRGEDQRHAVPEDGAARQVGYVYDRPESGVPLRPAHAVVRHRVRADQVVPLPHDPARQLPWGRMWGLPGARFLVRLAGHLPADEGPAWRCRRGRGRGGASVAAAAAGLASSVLSYPNTASPPSARHTTMAAPAAPQPVHDRSGRSGGRGSYELIPRASGPSVARSAGDPRPTSTTAFPGPRRERRACQPPVALRAAPQPADGDAGPSVGL
jgi:hypothetical protein